MSLLERLDAWDRAAFLALNGLHAPWSDALFSAVSTMELWTPLYVLFLFVLWKRYGTAGLLWAVPVIAAMVWCSDSGSVLLFKNTVQRLRPCHQPELAGLVHVVGGHCGGRFGFVSSHASNHFAIAAFLCGVLCGTRPWLMPALFAWAGLVAYSRIALGVHYPGDVVAGALYGLTVGSLAAAIFRHLAGRIAPRAVR